MKKKRVYCTHCGSRLEKKHIDDRERDYCPACDTIFYENPLPVASSIVLNDKREILLVKRKNDPYRDMWCLPIGFAESHEKLQEAALRELKEEAGIDGQIIQLIDVDTVDNYYYGSLAIVTYEVKRMGGDVKAGDDASDARYFPLDQRPPLAWSSNEKAIDMFTSLYHDMWAMIESFKHLYPSMDNPNDISTHEQQQEELLSNVLISMIDTDFDEITNEWQQEIHLTLPDLQQWFETITWIHTAILRSVQHWLGGNMSTSLFKQFSAAGKALRDLHVPLEEILTALALSRKSIWQHVIRKRILASPLEIYTSLELNNRIIFCYDRVIYNLTRGYFK